MKTITTILVLFSIWIIPAIAQEKIKLYLDKNFFSTDSSNASFIRYVEIINGHYRVTDKNISGQNVNYAEYSSVNPWINEGFARHYNEPDSLYAEGYYRDNNLVGQWKYFGENNRIDTVNYDGIESRFKFVHCEEFKKRSKKRKQKKDVEYIIDTLNFILNNNFNFPARSRAVNCCFKASIHFILDTDGTIYCPEISGVEDDDIKLEILRIISLFNPKLEQFESSLPINLIFDYQDKVMVDNEIYVVVDEMPTLVNNNWSNFREYIAQNLRYPEEAANRGIQGVVFV